MNRVAISSGMLQWARERAGLEIEDLLSQCPKLEQWESGEAQPTIKQLEKFAKAVHVPFGYLFMDSPPDEHLPIPDFRTFDNRRIVRPSPNLLDMLYICQERQDWYKEFAYYTEQPRRAYVGSADMSLAPAQVASKIRETIGFDLEARRRCSTWQEALRLFIQNADEAGILVMVSGVVLSNTQRKLDVKEFRGFALADDIAPLVFINGSDSKSGQMFTLAHELAHIWLNSSGISNASVAPVRGFSREEVWCNAVAAELLMPMQLLRGELLPNESVNDAVARLSRRFKVSALVVLRRLLDAGWLNQEDFNAAWAQERARLKAIAEKAGSGGDFYNTTIARVSRRFTKAVIGSTLEGHTLYRDAFRMLGVKKADTFNNLGRGVGVVL